MQVDFDTFRSHDYSNSYVFLWVFKKSNTPAKFSAHYVRTDDGLNQLLRDLVSAEAQRITEFSPYTYLAETNESSCLSLPSTTNDFTSLKALVDRPEPNHQASSISHLMGAKGYLVKFTHNNQTVYAVKKSSATWKTSYPTNFINLVFHNGQLAASQENGFSIERGFDFYYVESSTFILQKRSFESVVSYKAAYVQVFTDLVKKPDFIGLFNDLKPLVDYVGTNSIQLRRMATVQQRAVYARPDFLEKLRAVNAARGWGINFDQTGSKIVACGNTAKVILQVLLDHRLISEITQTTYDVPDATQV